MNATPATRTPEVSALDVGVPTPEPLLPLELQTLSLLLTTGVSLDDLLQEWAGLLTASRFETTVES